MSGDGERRRRDRDLAEVVELIPGISEAGKDEVDRAEAERPVARDGERRSTCRHRHIRLDEQARRVYCRDCDLEVPAFDALRELAVDHERYLHRWRDARDRAVRAEERLAELDRREKNAKSRIRRARQKAGPTALEVAARSVDLAWRLVVFRRVRPAPDKVAEFVAWLGRLVEPGEDDAGALPPEGQLDQVRRKLEQLAKEGEPGEVRDLRSA